MSRTTRSVSISHLNTFDFLLIVGLARILGARWNNESDEVRNTFTMLANELKHQHAIDHPNYQYAPRRPCERKRRATRPRTENSIFQESHISREQHVGGSGVVNNGTYNIEIDADILKLADDPTLFGPNDQVLTGAFDPIDYCPMSFDGFMNLDNSQDMFVTNSL